MKTMRLDLPDQIAAEIDRVIQGGWFHSPEELVRTALTEFLTARRHELIEGFQREDIAWAAS